MPIYEYRCEKGHLFETFQHIKSPPLEKCNLCDAKAKRCISRVNLPRGAGVYLFDRQHGNRDILHDPTISDSERSSILNPVLNDLKKNRGDQY